MTVSQPQHIIAIDTYGSQRVRGPASGAMISAYKISYTSVGRAALLALYGSRAMDVTPKQAHYHYVSIEGDVSVHKGFLLLALTDEEFTRAQQITRRHPSRRTGLFWWHESGWWHFPYLQASGEEISFTRISNREGPGIDPTRYRIVEASRGEKIAASEGIRAEYSQRSPHEPGWWWLSGDTYPHRELLKLKGCRWSKKRGAWYYQGAILPEAIQQLAQSKLSIASAPLPASEETTQEKHNRAEEPATHIPPITAPTVTRTHRFALGQTVYLASNVRVTPEIKLKMDTEGQVVRRYAYKKTPDFRHEIAYDIDFGMHGRHSVFQDNLDNQPQNLRGIERDETVMLMFGVSAEKAFLANIERRQRIPEEYTVLDEIHSTDRTLKADTPSHDDRPPTVSDQVEESSHPETQVSAKLLLPDIADEPLIKILPPPRLSADSLDDAVAQAICNTPCSIMPSSKIVQPGRDKKLKINHAPVGELTGSITGSVWCYGYALHGGVLLYLNLAGPRMAVEAIRAKLGKGDVVSLVPPDAPAFELSAGETDGKPNTGQYEAFIQTIPEAKFTNAILIHAALLPASRLAFTGILRTSDEQATRKVHHLVQSWLTIPVFPIWSDYLLDAGQRAGLIRPAFPSGGGIDLLIVERDLKAWQRLLTGGLANGVIRFPQTHLKDKEE